jgi:hypothetical protein
LVLPGSARIRGLRGEGRTVRRRQGGESLLFLCRLVAGKDDKQDA